MLSVTVFALVFAETIVARVYISLMVSTRETFMTLDRRTPMRLKFADEETEIDLGAFQGLWSTQRNARRGKMEYLAIQVREMDVCECARHSPTY